MSQSRFLTNALKAAELVLTAETADTAELVKIAAATSGIPADKILLGIDLTGIDLTNRDISHLLDKQAKYQGAILSAAQRRQFERSERQGVKRRMRMKIRSMRINTIIDFIEAHERNGNFPLGFDGARQLMASDLRAILLEPLQERYRGDVLLDTDYTINAIKGLVPWTHISNKDFFIRFFHLLSDLQTPTNQVVAEILDQKYFPVFGKNLGDMIAQMHTTSAIDSYWVVHVAAKNKTLMGDLRPDKSTEHVFKSSPLLRALQISRVRPVHQAAVEGALDVIERTSEAIEFLEGVTYDCNSDEAERIAARVTNAKWPPSETRSILNAHTHPRVRGALFRQLLQQGNEARIIEVLRWLNADRGAVGALSLDDAFRNIQSFGIGLRFAEEAAPSFADNQIAVVYFALRSLAKSSHERIMLEAFRKRLNYKPPKNIPQEIPRRSERSVETERLAKLFNLSAADDIS